MIVDSSNILALTPFERPDVALVRAIARAGRPAVLDLGQDPRQARRALAELARENLSFGVLVRDPAFDPARLPPSVNRVVLAPGLSPRRFAAWSPLCQVRSQAEATRAAAEGASGLLAKGWESGGEIGDETAFVLAQRLIGEQSLPVWVQGSFGALGAAACLAGGAAGVVFDDALSLAREASTPGELREAIAAMDGSETSVVEGRRTWRRPARPTDPALPLGGGAAFAASLAQRWPSAVAMLAGIETQVREALRLASDDPPLRRDNPLARSWSLPWPIAQGPMTRVSDGPDFAVAVSDGGALPFIALALMPAPRARAVLKDTAARLTGRTWGVGILGFVPPELREEQLAVLLEVRPPVVLIAGGRPSQARALEEQGIETWLHVPSPGLLDLYLRDGARRFVFEGRESGGHIGPRGSLSLWEAQVQRLLQVEVPEQLSLLFAGGVHDGRSAAMVAALCAPLAARGAKVGVLMGTAYLFTHEAVQTGAIQPGFQEEALRCEATAVLETAPGHATRCAPTPFVQAFAEERRRLEAQGLDPKLIWARLEELNLGRLRIAAKGLRRVGPDLEPVEAEAQRTEGMYMLGQVAGLRRSRLSIAQLHEEVVGGAAARLQALRTPVEAEVEAVGVPIEIAIIGMACIFPDAPDLQTYWANVLDGRCAIREVPADRWSTDIFFDPESRGAAGGQTYCKVGGWLPWVRFDPLEFGIPPRSLVSIEPTQLLALEVARQALADAGYDRRPFDRQRAAVVFGAESGTELGGAYGFRTLYRQYVGDLPAELDAVLPRFTEDSFPGVLANVISGRIANRLDLGGPNYTVDAACASSLAALDAAVKELVTGGSDLAIAGGVDLHNGINDFVLFSSVHALSRRGECRVFDAEADGTVIGEGVAAVVLKRLDDARRDGDRIYAIVRGVGSASDGKSLGLTAPRREGQVRAVRRAWAQARRPTEQVGLIEAHGTGTVVGDKTEVAALSEVFAGAPARSVGLGSVKSQIGHTKCAAGLAGLIKAAMALHTGIRPPTIGVRTPNPGWSPATSPFDLAGIARPWGNAARLAGVSAFGFGGTNFHAVLEADAEAAPPRSGRAQWPAELFLFRGPDRETARRRLAALAALLDTDESLSMRDLARSTSTVGEGRAWYAVVAGNRDELRRRLHRAADGLSDPRGVFLRQSGDSLVEQGGNVAFLFPGQGSQRPYMLADLFLAFPALQELLELGRPWLDLLFPPAAHDEAERHAALQALTDTRVAQPALGIAGLAMARVLESLALAPAAMGGHSYGELVALCHAGALEPEALLPLSEARGRCILDAAGDDPGAMAAVSASAELVAHLLADLPEVVLANRNGPDQVVIAGPTEAVRAACERLALGGHRARTIPVAAAFHSPLIAGAEASFAAALAGVELGEPSLPVWSNRTAAPHETANLAESLARHIVSPVRFDEQIRAMYDSGIRIFVEVGPGGVLTRLVERILADRPHLAVQTDDGAGPTLVRLLLTLGTLAVNDVSFDVEPLFEGRQARRLDLSRPVLPSGRDSDWWVNGLLARPVKGDLPSGAMIPVTTPVVRAGPGSAAPGLERERVVSDYLEGMRRLVEAQREVMLGYLGASAPAEPLRRSPVEARPMLEVVSTTPSLPAAAAVAAVAESLEQTLLGIVSERTGYPIDMLAPDLDLEADLSIDSIKRIEILGLLSEKMGLSSTDAADRDAVIEQLAGVRTLRGIVTWLETRESTGARPAETNAPAAVPAAPLLAIDEVSEVVSPPTFALRRFVLGTREQAPSTPGDLRGRRVMLSEDGRGLARSTARLLEQRGARARVVQAQTLPENGEDLVDLVGWESRDQGVEPARHLFDWVKAAAPGPRRLLAVTGLGGGFGAPRAHSERVVGGLAGLLRTVARERDDLGVRAVDLDPAVPVGELAELLVSELATLKGPTRPSEVEVGFVAGRRITPVVEAQSAGPLDQGLGLSPESVVLVTGGARGIAARASLALMRASPCRLILVGRSPLPEGEEDPELAAVLDRKALRPLLLARLPGRPPREIEAELERILAAREIRANLAALREAAVSVEYEAVDVRDEVRFGRLIEAVYEQFGRIDGVVHAAGVLEDKLLSQKTGESFDRVFDTKVKGARVIARHLRPGAAFVVFFGSVSGVFGNRGQVDYSAANDFLDKLARSSNGVLARRVLSIDWGPWGGGGMVSPELEREYARRGIGLIDPEQGAQAMVDELRFGDPSEAQILYMCGAPESLA